VQDTVIRLLEASGGGAGGPPLVRARSVGRAITWLMLTQLIAGVLLGVGPALPVVAAVIPFQGAEDTAAIERVTWWLWALSSAAVLSGLFGVRTLAAPFASGSDPESRRSAAILTVSLLVSGLILAIGSVLRWLWWETQRGVFVDSVALEWLMVTFALIVAAGAVFYGDAAILRRIGARSRLYRQSRGARQGLRAMLYALLFIGIGAALVGAGDSGIDALRPFGRFIIISSTIMVLIGQAYLLINVWWIRLALLEPPRRLAELVRIEPDPSFIESG